MVISLIMNQEGDWQEADRDWNESSQQRKIIKDYQRDDDTLNSLLIKIC